MSAPRESGWGRCTSLLPALWSLPPNYTREIISSTSQASAICQSCFHWAAGHIFYPKEMETRKKLNQISTSLVVSGSSGRGGARSRVPTPSHSPAMRSYYHCSSILSSSLNWFNNTLKINQRSVFTVTARVTGRCICQNRGSLKRRRSKNNIHVTAKGDERPWAATPQGSQSLYIKYSCITSLHTKVHNTYVFRYENQVKHHDTR